MDTLEGTELSSAEGLEWPSTELKRVFLCFVQVDGYIVHPFIFFAYFHWYFFFLTVLVLLAYFLYTKGFFLMKYYYSSKK